MHLLPAARLPEHRPHGLTRVDFDCAQPREAALLAMLLDECGYVSTQVCYTPPAYRRWRVINGAHASHPAYGTTTHVMWCNGEQLDFIHSLRATNAALGQLGAYQ